MGGPCLGTNVRIFFTTRIVWEEHPEVRTVPPGFRISPKGKWPPSKLSPTTLTPLCQSQTLFSPLGLPPLHIYIYQPRYYTPPVPPLLGLYKLSTPNAERTQVLPL